MNRSLAIAVPVKSVVGLALVALAAGCGGGALQQSSVASGAQPPARVAACALGGDPRILATQIDPTGGLTVGSRGGVMSFQFATTLDGQGVTYSIDPETLKVLGIETRSSDAAAAVTPVEIGLPDHERLIAWTPGAREASAQPGDGFTPRAAADEKNNLGFQGTAVGRPAVAFGTNGKGVLAFIESSKFGYQVVAVRATCEQEKVASRVP